MEAIIKWQLFSFVRNVRLDLCMAENNREYSWKMLEIFLRFLMLHKEILIFKCWYLLIMMSIMNFLRFYDILLTSKIKSQNGLKIPFSPYLPYIIVKISNMYVEFFYSKYFGVIGAIWVSYSLLCLGGSWCESEDTISWKGIIIIKGGDEEWWMEILMTPQNYFLLSNKLNMKFKRAG